jgi:hypothetical protein
VALEGDDEEEQRTFGDEIGVEVVQFLYGVWMGVLGDHWSHLEASHARPPVYSKPVPILWVPK